MDSMLFLKKRNIQPPAGQQILKQEEFGNLIEANKVLEQAHIKASETIAEAYEIYEAKKNQGYEDGLEEGRREHAQKIMDTALQTIDYFESMEKSIAGLVTQCLERVIGELDEDELILKIVRSGLAVARNEKKVVVRVCPDEVKYVQKATSSLLQAFPGINLLDIVADERLSKGACLIESELGVVDAGITTQLEAIKRAINKRI